MFFFLFCNKVDSLRQELDVPHLLDYAEISIDVCSSCLGQFKSLSLVEVKELLKKSKTKSCDMDPIPTSILKKCLETLGGQITSIINSSLSQSHFPSILKRSMVIPSIKKNSLNPNKFSSYRPISNLSFLSKIIEKSIAMQLERYLLENNLYPQKQSGYRRYHSTETVLIKIFNHECCALDDGRNAVLVLLDLSSAFDNHEILLERLQTRFGFTGEVLIWLRSYLTERQQFVVLIVFNLIHKLLDVVFLKDLS